MKTAIILHGMPSKKEYFNRTTASQSNRHWLPWIQKQLILSGVLAQALEMPAPYKPDYKKFCSVFERFDVDKNTILIGHSLGGGFLMRWLSEHKKTKAGKVVLVAPWLDPRGELKNSFFKFKLDKDLARRTKGLYVVYSGDDVADILDTVEVLKKKVKGLRVRKLSGKGHLTFSAMKTDKFPELKNIILR